MAEPKKGPADAAAAGGALDRPGTDRDWVGPSGEGVGPEWDTGDEREDGKEVDEDDGEEEEEGEKTKGHMSFLLLSFLGLVAMFGPVQGARRL